MCLAIPGKVLTKEDRDGAPIARVARLGPWIEVRGKLKVLNDRFGNQALFIDGATVSEVPPPDDILLYPRRRKTPW